MGIPIYNFKNKARIPVVPLSYEYKDFAKIREIVVNYKTGDIYVCIDDGTLVNICASETTMQEFAKYLKDHPDILDDLLVTLPDGSQDILKNVLNKFYEMIKQIDDRTFDYAGSEYDGGPANSAEMLEHALTVTTDEESTIFNGTEDVSVDLTKYYHISGGPVTGPVELKNKLILTENEMFGPTLPATGEEGQLFFLMKSDGSVHNVPQAVPIIDVDSNGLVKATSIQVAGYVSAGTTEASKQLPTKAAQTITPGTEDKKIPSGTYLTGDQTIEGDPNLLPENIISGKSIFGIEGTGSGSGDAPPSITVDENTGLITSTAGGKSSTKQLSVQVAQTVTPGTADKTIVAVNKYTTGAQVVKGDENLVPENIIAGKSIFGVTGNVSVDLQPEPTINVSSSGLITATAGTKFKEHQLEVLDSQSYTPGTTDKAILPGKYITGRQIIKGDENLVPENIVNGKSIFGVSGTANPQMDIVIDFDEATGLITARAGDSSVTRQVSTQGEQIINPSTADQTIAKARYLVGNQTIKGDSNLVPENIVSGKTIFNVNGNAETASSVLNSNKIIVTTNISNPRIFCTNENLDKVNAVYKDGKYYLEGLTWGKHTVRVEKGNFYDTREVDFGENKVLVTKEIEILLGVPKFEYKNGEYEIIPEGISGDWKIKFLTSGTLTFNDLTGMDNGVDIFMVGGGASGSNSGNQDWGVGGGAGYTGTIKKYTKINEGIAYEITIGSGGAPCTDYSNLNHLGHSGGKTIAFGYGIDGGLAATTFSTGSELDPDWDIYVRGGHGGSGGGGSAGNGGSDGYSGKGGYPGRGQRSNTGGDDEGGWEGATTTREFGEESGKLYAGGGGGGGGGKGGDGGGGNGISTDEKTPATSGEPNTGGGGGGGCQSEGVISGAGGSGILIIRNSRY